jgi:hypothetical protein
MRKTRMDSFLKMAAMTLFWGWSIAAIIFGRWDFVAIGFSFMLMSVFVEVELEAKQIEGRGK